MDERQRKLGLVFGCLAGIAAATCGGKVVVDQGSADVGGGSTGGSGTGNVSTNTGGVGNAGPSQVSATSGPVASSVASTNVSVGVSDGSGGASSCTTCSDVIQNNGDPMDLCPDSAAIFEAFVGCVCNGPCAMECQSACGGSQPGPGCNMCIQSSCSKELSDCFLDQ